MIESKTLIIIPVFNGADYIKKSLESCLIQTLKTHILVVDNCSIDNTQQIVKDYAKKNNCIKLIVNKRNHGRIGNLNVCLDHFMNSQYKYLKLLFVGDELVENSIEIVENIFLNNAHISMVNGLYIFNNGKIKKEVAKYFPKDGRVNIDGLIKQGIYPSSATGTLNSVTYSRQGIGEYRLNPLFLGLAMFHNKILLTNGDIYYTNNVVGIFNLDAHRSFDKQFDYLYRYEYAFVKMHGLEESREFFSTDEYNTMKQNIAVQLVIECLSIGKFKLLFRVVFEVFNRIKVKVIYKLNYNR